MHWNFYTGEEARKKFMDFWDDFFKRDFQDFGKDFKEFGKEFARDMRNFGREFKETMGRGYTDCSPLMNVVETESQFRIELAAPGLKKEDFKINLKDNVLTITTDLERTFVEGEKYRKREFDFQKFKRTYELPDHADPEQITAQYENGLLLIYIGKKAHQETEEEGQEIKIS